MTDALPSAPALAAFLAGSLVLAVTPGPGVLYIVARTLSRGRRAGLASVAGVALGNLGNAAGASLGLAALFAMSSAAFAAVKYAGAAYLVCLGIRALRAPVFSAPPSAAPPSSRRHDFRDGFIVALLNPKTALFFAAFLPQFLGAGSASMTATLFLGALFVAVAATTDTAYALAAGAVAPVFARANGVPTFGRYLAGSSYIGLGLFTAFSGHRSSR